MIPLAANIHQLGTSPKFSLSIFDFSLLWMRTQLRCLFGSFRKWKTHQGNFVIVRTQFPPSRQVDAPNHTFKLKNFHLEWRWMDGKVLIPRSIHKESLSTATKWKQFSHKSGEIIKNWRWWKQYRSWDCCLSCGSMMNAKVWSFRVDFVSSVSCLRPGRKIKILWMSDERKRILPCILRETAFREVRQTFASSAAPRSYLFVQDIQINLLNTRWDEKEKRWKNINFHSDDGFCTKGDEKAWDVS